jgi:4-hydroxybenzoate polyprenyltransferase
MTLTSIARVVRAANWFTPKIAPLTAVAYAQILFSGLSPGEALPRLLAGIAALCGVGAFGHVVNDIFDIEEDRRSGKDNAFDHRSSLQKVLITGVCLGLVFIPAVLGGFSGEDILLLCVNCLLPTIYSIKPFRLKEHGLWGVACDALGAHVVPTAFMLSLFSIRSPITTENRTWQVVLLIWSLLTGIKNILRHQLYDRDRDIFTRTLTFVSVADPNRVAKVLSKVIWPLELVAFVTVVFLMRRISPLVGIAFLIYTAVEFTKHFLGWKESFDHLRKERTANLPVVNNYFYESWFPLSLSAQLASDGTGFVLLPVFQAAMCWVPVLEQWREGKRLLRDLAGISAAKKGKALALRLRWGWDLRVAGNGRARFERVEGIQGFGLILEPSAMPYDISLSRRTEGVRRGHYYRLIFRARASRNRTAICSVSESTPPWNAVGLYKEFELGTEWQNYQSDFVATRDEEDALSSFLLGGDEARVQFCDVRLEELLSEHPLILEQHGQARAQIVEDPESGSQRLEICRPGTLPWHVKLVSAGHSLSGGMPYRLRFRARAEALRRIEFGSAQNHEPWANLGLAEQAVLTTEWETFSADFVSSEGDANGCIYFMLGGDANGVDVTDIDLAPQVTAENLDQVPG